MRFLLSRRWIGVAVIFIMAAMTIGAHGVMRAAIRSLAPQTTILPKGIPNPDFWWALPSLLKTGYPVILPTWLPRSGKAGATFDPEKMRGFPPITISVTPRSRKTAALPGYSIGIGDVGSDGAVPVLSNTRRSFIPRIVPTTLTSPWTYSTDGRDSPPLGIRVLKLPTPFRPIGFPVRLQNGLVVHIRPYVSGGTMGNFVTVGFQEGSYLVQLTYPGLDRRTALRMVASLVRVVAIPKTLQVAFDTHQLTLTLNPTTFSRSVNRGHSHAYGYRYRIRTIRRLSQVTSTPPVGTVVPPKVPDLPPLPCNTCMLEIPQPPYVFPGAWASSPMFVRSPFLIGSPVLLPRWLPPTLHMRPVMAWRTRVGYYVGFLPGPNGPVAYGWAQSGQTPKLFYPRRVSLIDGKMGTLGRTSTGWQLNVPLGSDITGYLSGAVAPAQLLRAATKEIRPSITISSVPGHQPLPGGRLLSLRWGRGSERVGPRQVQIVGWAYHQTYAVIVRGPGDRLKEALKIAQSLTRAD